jgi:NAD(P)-dependent dehydrogenase (short-subunit alcohol dehydrogenase family)
MKHWKTDQISSQNGKVIIVTGGGSGIGLEAAKALAAKGAEVILAVRTVEKGDRAAARIREVSPDANVSVMHLDLGDLGLVKQFTDQFKSRYNRLDILINNAGVMVPPYKKTAEGYELQFGTNHLGHFTLTGLLMQRLLETPDSRIVTVSSIAARGGRIDFDNLDGSKKYNPMTFYRQSKFSNLLFAVELQHRLSRAGSKTLSIACHPGISNTNLVSRGSGRETGWLLRQAMKLVLQSAEMGSLPTLFAATNPDLRGGEFIGPDGRGNHRGYPVITGEEAKIFKQDVATKLWEFSEKVTGVRFPV